MGVRLQDLWFFFGCQFYIADASEIISAQPTIELTRS
jgi:hypothetical protein